MRHTHTHTHQGKVPPGGGRHTYTHMDDNIIAIERHTTHKLNEQTEGNQGPATVLICFSIKLTKQQQKTNMFWIVRMPKTRQ